jgi:hypothetical protein
MEQVAGGFARPVDQHARLESGVLTMRRNFLTAILLLVSACVQVPTTSAGTLSASSKSSVSERLTEAKDDYSSELKEVRNAVLADLKSAADRALDAGRKDAFDALKADEAAFVTEARWPRTVNVRAYQRRVQVAARQLAGQYQRAIREFSREKQVAAASQAQKDLAGLFREHFRFWRHRGGSFVRLNETDWEEAAPGGAHYRFREVRRTDEYVELSRNGCLVRLYADRCDVSFTPFASSRTFYRGAWTVQ